MNQDTTTTLGEWLRDTRKSKGKGITIYFLAGQLELSPSYISEIENDRRTPSEDVLRGLTTLLGLSFDEAMSRSARIGLQAERYLKRSPSLVMLIRELAAAGADDAAIDRLRAGFKRTLK